MAEMENNRIDQTGVFTRFPPSGDSGDLKADQTNPAIRLYGRRFYKDQTPVEYLAEFLLVFASSKRQDGEGTYQLRLEISEGKSSCYWPEDRVALKLFAFFPTSKLETRHPVHRQAYLDALEEVKAHVAGSLDEKSETVRLIQSLFGGFVGVAKNRTWVTYSFLPASTVLLARELDWLHSEAIKDKKLTSWKEANKYFAADRHNFMARGGELLFLQLANLFAERDAPEITSMLKHEEYQHLKTFGVVELIGRLEQKLRNMLEEAISLLGGLVELIEDAIEKALDKNDSFKKQNKSPGSLGWVPMASRIEALLFAVEMDNLCASSLSALEKLELLQTLCCMQVLRSLCFQARRVDEAQERTPGFIGDYAWIVTASEAKVGAPIRQMAQNSFNHIEAMLYRVLRKKEVIGNRAINFTEADKHGFQIFRKIAKEISLVIPRQGSGQRFTLHQGLLRFLVAALVRPGERVRLTHFYQRVFAHYGIALGGQQLTTALAWSGSETGSESYAVSSSTAWVEEALQQGGFLVELSDAVSMVHNAGHKS